MHSLCSCCFVCSFVVLLSHCFFEEEIGRFLCVLCSEGKKVGVLLVGWLVLNTFTFLVAKFDDWNDFLYFWKGKLGKGKINNKY